MNVRNKRFVLLNLVSTLIEYFLIFSTFFYLFKNSFLISIIITGSIFIFFLILTVLAFKSFEVKEDKNKNYSTCPNYDLFNDLINKANKRFGLNLGLLYDKLPQPNPAFFVGKTICINTTYNINKDVAKGVIAHEIGHAYSGLSKYTAISSLRPSSAISNAFKLLTCSLCYKDNILLKILSIISFSLFILFSLANLVVLFPFMREDEFIANSVCVKLNAGHEIRTYYGTLLDETPPLLFKLTDLAHPSVGKMIECLDKDLKLKKIEKDIFACAGSLYKTNQQTINLYLDDSISKIKSNALKYKYKKIKGNFVTYIEPNVLNNQDELEELYAPNLKYLYLNDLKRLDKLKKIYINDDALKLNIVKCEYLKNKLFYNDLYNELKNKNLINE